MSDFRTIDSDRLIDGLKINNLPENTILELGTKATKDELDLKQNILIPGTNITIVGDTINSLGGPAVVTDGFNRNYFTATAGQTIFDLTFTYTPGNGEILVFVNGNIVQATIVYNETDNNTITFLNGLDVGTIVQVITGVKGDNGTNGLNGTDGNGILSIALISGDHSPGSLDTYRITYTDTTTFDFSVYNGADGSDATGNVITTDTLIDNQIITGAGGTNIKNSGKSIVSVLIGSNDVIPTDYAVTNGLNTKQNTLVSGTNIKTLNGQDIIGSGNIEIIGGGGAVSGNVFLTNLTSTIVPAYKQTSYTADVTETILTGTANNNEVLVATYLFDTPVGLTSIPAGTWNFAPTGYISSSALTSFIRIETFKRTAGGVETTLFSATSNSIENTVREILSFSSTQPAFTVNTTDYLGSRVYFSTTRSVNTTISIVVGDGNASYFTTPLPIRASQVRNTPAGNISSIDVQGAINELDTEKLTNSISTNKLLGRGTAGTGVIEEITLGTGLSLTGTTLNASGGGLSWASSITGTSGTGFTTTIGNSASASTIGQSIVSGDTQTNAVTLLNLDTGASSSNSSAIVIKSLNTDIGATNGSIVLNAFGSTTQLLKDTYSLHIGDNLNTNSGFSHSGIFIRNEQNAGAGLNQAIRIFNYSTELSTSSGAGSGLNIGQYGVGGTAIAVFGQNNVNTSTNGLVNYTLTNTQSGATVVQKINTGTSAQGQVAYLAQVYNASTSATAFQIDPSTTCTGRGIYFSNYGGNGFKGIGFEYINGTSSGINYGIHFNDSIAYLSGGIGFGIYQNMISTNGTGYGLYISNLSNSTGTAIGLYIGGLTGATNITSKFFSLNNITSGGLVSRTVDMSEILSSRINTSTTGTKTDNFNTLNIKRSSTQNGTGGTFVSNGSVLKLENVATKTAGTITDTVAVLNLIQGNDSTGGHILFNAYSGTPTTDGTLYFDGTNFKCRVGGVTYTITKS